MNEDDAEVPREDETVMLLATRGLLLLLTPPGLHTPLGRGPGGQTGSEHLFSTHSTEHHDQGGAIGGGGRVVSPDDGLQCQDDHHPAPHHLHIFTFISRSLELQLLLLSD